MKTGLHPLETALLAVFVTLLALALFGPALAQPADHHAFADARAWQGIPFALDVLSNLPFLAAAILGFAALRRVPAAAMPAAQRGLAALFLAGLAVTAAGSAWYHWQPDDTGLAVDRLGMVLAFAGLLGLAVADRISSRAGIACSIVVLLAGPLSVWVWSASGNVMPWAVVQFGGMLLVCLLALRRPLPTALGLRLGLVIAVYALAKLLELGDHQVFEATGGLVSGHSLKHVVAALAAWPVISALNAASGSGHNAVQRARDASFGIKPARNA